MLSPGGRPRSSPAPAPIFQEHGLDTFESGRESLLPRNCTSTEATARDPIPTFKAGADAEQEIKRERGDRIVLALYMIPEALQRSRGHKIIGHAGHNFASAILLDIRGGLLFQMAKQVVPQIVLNLARNADNDPSREK